MNSRDVWKKRCSDHLVPHSKFQLDSSQPNCIKSIIPPKTSGWLFARCSHGPHETNSNKVHMTRVLAALDVNPGPSIPTEQSGHRHFKKGIRRLVGHVSYRCTLIWQALYCVFSVDDIHQRNTGNLSYASSEFTITSCNDITFMWCDSLDKTVIGIGTSMGTSESFKSWIARYTIVSNQLNSSPFMIANWRTDRSARRYFEPSFSSSARTQSVTHGIPAIWKD